MKGTNQTGDPEPPGDTSSGLTSDTASNSTSSATSGAGDPEPPGGTGTGDPEPPGGTGDPEPPGA